MNLKEIKEMINLMNENDLTEIEVEREGSKIKLRKSAPDDGTGMSRPVQYRIEPPREAKEPPAAAGSGEASGAPKAGQKIIASPMVGTFYRAPSPESPPFVEVGQIVEVGQVVCIVEAMKLMNEIKSEVKGRVVEVAIENAEPVEFGQSLFVVEPV